MGRCNTNKFEKNNRTWKILIVDDEQDIHKIIKMIFDNHKIDDMNLEIFSACNSDEAIFLLKENSDIAVALVDIVMETEDAGINCVRRIRNELKNDKIRLILKTGYPSQIPGPEILEAFDISMFKQETDLTTQIIIEMICTSIKEFQTK